MNTLGKQESSRYRVSPIEATDIDTSPLFEISVPIDCEALKSKVRESNIDSSKQQLTIGDYIIKPSLNDPFSLSINGHDLNYSYLRWDHNIVFYPHEVVVTDDKQTVQYINQHMVARGGNNQERKADLIASNETMFAYVTDRKLYKKSLKENSSEPEEIVLPDSMKIVKPMIVTKSGNIVYVLEKSGNHELHMNGERIGDIPEFAAGCSIQLRGDICTLSCTLLNGINKHYSIDTTLSASRPEGTDARVALARAATARVLDSNARLTKDLDGVTLEKLSLEDQIAQLIGERDALRTELMDSRVGITKLQNTISTLKSIQKNSEQRFSDAQEQDLNKIRLYQEQLGSVQDLLVNAPRPTGMISKSISEELFNNFLYSLRTVIKS